MEEFLEDSDDDNFIVKTKEVGKEEVKNLSVYDSEDDSEGGGGGGGGMEELGSFKVEGGGGGFYDDSDEESGEVRRRVWRDRYDVTLVYSDAGDLCVD